MMHKVLVAGRPKLARFCHHGAEKIRPPRRLAGTRWSEFTKVSIALDGRSYPPIFRFLLNHKPLPL
jgi:hypothetical protein